MAEKKESSVLFSLRELRNLEDDRVKSEADAAAAREAAEKQAKLDAERRAREEEEAKLRAEQERVRAEQERKDALEREERIRVQETERKAQVEAQMQLEQQRLHLEHQQKLAAAPTKSHKMLYGIVAGMAVLVIGLGIFYYRHTQQAARERKRAAAELAALQKTLDETTAEADRINREIASIQGQILNANEADRERLKKELEKKQREAQANAARANDAKTKISSRGSGKPDKPKGPKINLDIDTSNATGGINGK